MGAFWDAWNKQGAANNADAMAGMQQAQGLAALMKQGQEAQMQQGIRGILSSDEPMEVKLKGLMQFGPAGVQVAHQFMQVAEQGENYNRERGLRGALDSATPEQRAQPGFLQETVMRFASPKEIAAPVLSAAFRDPSANADPLTRLLQGRARALAAGDANAVKMYDSWIENKNHPPQGSTQERDRALLLDVVGRMKAAAAGSGPPVDPGDVDKAKITWQLLNKPVFDPSQNRLVTPGLDDSFNPWKIGGAPAAAPVAPPPMAPQATAPVASPAPVAPNAAAPAAPVAPRPMETPRQEADRKNGALRDWEKAAILQDELAKETAYVPKDAADEARKATNIASIKRELAALPSASGNRTISVQKLPTEITPELEARARAIAEGRMPPIPPGRNNNDARTIMEQVFKINPKYDAKDFGNASAAVKAFGTGRQAMTVNAFNVALDHMETLEKLGDALNNGDTPLVNKLANFYAAQTGEPAPVSFDAVKRVVGNEIIKAVIGAAGALGDRKEADETLSRASSPAQLKGVMESYRLLMAGQLKGLERVYTNSTKRTDFDSMLGDAAKVVFGKSQGQQPTGQPAPKAALDYYKMNKNVPGVKDAFIKKYGYTPGE
jgi:hypothetical protein